MAPARRGPSPRSRAQPRFDRLQESRMTSPASFRAHADLALAVYLEPQVEGRRVLLLGSAEGALADRLDQLAAYLEIIDPAAREPSRGEVPELPFDDESFDLVLVLDAATLPTPANEALRELQRVLARGGLLAVGAAASSKRRARREPPAHAALEGLLQSAFRNVRVLSQSPLSGFAVGELEPRRGEDVTVDSSLLRDARREPDRLLGLASSGKLPAEGRLWIEVPAGEGEDAAVQPKASLDDLRRAEDEAREALHREADLLRKLETERRARTEAEQLAERARLFERKLLAAEADYDDAVARVRYFESAIAEHEAATRHERDRIHGLERELSQLKGELANALDRKARGDSERESARLEAETAAQEIEALETRLGELGRQLLGLEQDKKAHEQTARDLLEELRRLEQDKSAAVEHDARVAELEAERDRAVQRSSEAEHARASAQARADDLRRELEQQRTLDLQPDDRDWTIDSLRGELEQRELEVARAHVEGARQRGELQGMRMRLEEAERALASGARGTSDSSSEVSDLRMRLAHTEANLHAMREAGAAGRTSDPVANDRERTKALEAQLAQADLRLHELTRELEEADRFAELHAEDADRLNALEGEFEDVRGQRDELEDEVRSLEEDLRTARTLAGGHQDELTRVQRNLDGITTQLNHRIEQAERHEVERDDARAALAEARGILSQLASHVGADANDPTSIVQAVFAQQPPQGHDDRERVIDELKSNLQGRDARIQQLERWLNEARPEGEQDRPEN